MENFIKKQREIIAVVAYIFFIAVLIYGIVLPVYGKIGEMKDRIQEEQIIQESKRKSLSELPVISSQFEKIENSTFLNSLLDRENAVGLIESLEKLASESGNEIAITAQEQTNTKNTSAKSKKAQEKENIISLPNENYLQLKITLQGDFNTIVKFIKKLENFPYYNDIISMQIQKNTEKRTDKNIFSPTEGRDTIENTGKDLEGSFDIVFYTKQGK